MSVRQLSAWGLDYVYAGVQQARSLTHRRSPECFADGDPALPAIVLLPGVYETWLFLEPVARRLNAGGFRVFTVPELSFNRMSIPRSAEIVASVLNRLHRNHGTTEFVLVAHSKGGLIGKHLMLDHSDEESQQFDIRGLVAIATPFSGSHYAQFLPSRTLRAFSPRDSIVRALLEQQQINERIVSIYGEFDPHIPGGSGLDGAHNIELPLSGHFRILQSDLLIETVEREVTAFAHR
ncbi:hypothetical protein GCM10022381_14990 [Leifsonia kafniensis]|uniref:Alpha/beta hydrolase n=1 Tax=Leifsonia kafniensis TaxID=475957 RepID=A0ABP7KCJ0_9MICO